MSQGKLLTEIRLIQESNVIYKTVNFYNMCHYLDYNNK